MNRQRVLERTGWTFWRCFASTWCLRRDEVLAELLERLSSMGIEPIGSTGRFPNLVEKRIWTAPPSVAEAADEAETALRSAISASREPD